MTTSPKITISRPLLELSATVFAAYIVFRWYSSAPLPVTFLLIIGVTIIPLLLKKPEYIILLLAFVLPFRDIHLISVLYVKRVLIWGSFAYLLLRRMNQIPAQFPFRPLSQFTKATLFFLVALIISLTKTAAALHSMVSITTVEVKAALFFYGPQIIDQLALVYIAYYAMTSWTHIRHLIDGMLVTAGIISVLGILQYLFKGTVPYLERLYEPELKFYDRATSIFLNPNELGCYLAVMFVMAFITGILSNQRRKRALFYVPMTLLCFIGTLLSFSRGAIAQIFLGLFTFGVIYYGWLSPKKLSRRLLVSIILFISITAISGYLYDTYMRMRLIGYREGAYQQALYVTHHTNDYLRRYAAVQAFKAFSEHPIFGIGFGLFSPKQLAYGISPHNQYLKILAEMGSSGFIPFLLMLLLPINACIRLCRSAPDKTATPVFLTLLSGSITILYGNFFSDMLASMAVTGNLWLIFGSIFVLERECSISPGNATTEITPDLRHRS